MTTELIRALTGTPERPELAFRRHYPASVAELREACTRPERLARWFGTITGAPAAVGDEFTADLSDDPSDAALGCDESCSDDGFSVSWSWQDERPSRIDVRFDADDDGSVITVHHRLAEPDHAVGYGGGWEQILHALARILDPDRTDLVLDDDVEAAGVQAWRTIGELPLEVERVVSAPIDAVWAAFTTPEGLKRWWWRHWDDTAFAVQLHEGGAYRIESASMGISVSGHYLAVEAPRRLACTWVWTDDNGVSSDEAVNVRFEPTDGGTRIRIRHTGRWIDRGPAEDYRRGWEFTLSQLREAIAEG